MIILSEQHRIEARSLYCESQFSTLGDTRASGTERSGCGMSPVAALASSVVAVTTLILDSGVWARCAAAAAADTVKMAKSDNDSVRKEGVSVIIIIFQGFIFTTS